LESKGRIRITPTSLDRFPPNLVRACVGLPQKRTPQGQFWGQSTHTYQVWWKSVQGPGRSRPGTSRQTNKRCSNYIITVCEVDHSFNFQLAETYDSNTQACREIQGAFRGNHNISTLDFTCIVLTQKAPFAKRC
jgi:hypothetical protein